MISVRTVASRYVVRLPLPSEARSAYKYIQDKNSMSQTVL